MNYPLITEYLQSVASAEDNLDKLAHLRPVLDDHGEPYRSSGAFAVVFKMQDPASGKCYALKCFTEEQSGRAEAYRLIAEELSAVDSPYIISVQYYDKELFVDSSCADESEFPVLLMDWVEGITMEQHIRENHQDSTKMQWLCYRFCRMAAWLRSQAMAHGDIKPDNVIVRPDGSLTLVDYDGMFVPAMKGQQSPTLGTRDFSHPERTVEDFDETIDDFALATTALSLKAIALDAAFYTHCGGTDRLLFSADDYRDLSQSQIWVKLQQLMYDKEFATLASQFLAALSQKTLQHLSFRLFNLSKPKAEELDYIIINEPTPNSDFHIQFKDGNCLYFKYDKEDPSKVWVVAPDKNEFEFPNWKDYSKPTGNIIIPCKVAMYQVVEIEYYAFYYCSSLQSIYIPDSVTKIWRRAFLGCSSLRSVVIPDSVMKIGFDAFMGCSCLQSVVIPDSVMEIGSGAFDGCSSLRSIVVDKNNQKYDSRGNCNAIIETSSNKLIAGCQNTIIPDSVREIWCFVFSGCSSLQTIVIPDSVRMIGPNAFSGCSSLQTIIIPDSVRVIGSNAFSGCSSLQTIVIPDSATKIEERTFSDCISLQTIVIPKLITKIGGYAFMRCSNLQNIEIPDSVKQIGGYAFSGCSSLQSIYIPDSVKQIGGYAFSRCSSLQSIIIPDTVEKIGKHTFSSCISLQSIKIKNPDLLEGTGVNLDKVKILTDENESGNVAENNGLLPGLFSVGPGRYVRFTKGNLQYQASTGLWRFAERQYHIIGLDNSRLLFSSYKGWIDLFGWSTPATTFGVATSKNYDDYTGEFRDWGQNNIGGNAVGSFRTLSRDEWEYLLGKRADAKNKYATGCIQLADDKYVCGCFFLPDTWTLPDGCSFNPGVSNQSDVVYSKNTYSLVQWAAMEQAGAIFLPAAGYRRGTSVDGVDPVGYGSYWSADNSYSKCAWGIVANYDNVIMKYLYRGDGRSVRLVQDIKK